MNNNQFTGVYPLRCIKCDKLEPKDIVFPSEPTEEEWAVLRVKLYVKDWVCVECLK